MKRSFPLLMPCESASDFFGRYERYVSQQRRARSAKVAGVLLLSAIFVVGHASPTAQTSIVSVLQKKLVAIQKLQSQYRDLETDELTRIAEAIRFATDDRLSEREALRYAGLIYHSARLYEINPLDIIALIAAESSFRADVVNKQTNDFGLGQVNWKYWGKPYGLTQQDLMDPVINIVMTCHVYKYYGEDFAKYHRGDGIKSKAYLVNVRGILSSLKAFVSERFEIQKQEGDI